MKESVCWTSSRLTIRLLNHKRPQYAACSWAEIPVVQFEIRVVDCELRQNLFCFLRRFNPTFKFSLRRLAQNFRDYLHFLCQIEIVPLAPSTTGQ